MSLFSELKSINSKKNQNKLKAEKIAGNINIINEKKSKQFQNFENQKENEKINLEKNIFGETKLFENDSRDRYLSNAFEKKNETEKNTINGVGGGSIKKANKILNEKGKLKTQKSQNSFDFKIDKLKNVSDNNMQEILRKQKENQNEYAEKISNLAIDLENINKTLENLNKEEQMITKDYYEREAQKQKAAQEKERIAQEKAKKQSSFKKSTNIKTENKTTVKNEYPKIEKINMSSAANKVVKEIDDNIIMTFEGKKTINQMKNIIKNKILREKDKGTINNEEASMLLKKYGCD
ncbi:MAG: hypothetical protein RR640_01960 [Oscillospiraceae bacterium]